MKKINKNYREINKIALKNSKDRKIEVFLVDS